MNFYPKYQIYFGLFNHGGTLIDIENARDDMIETLLKELSYAFAKQFFATVVFIVGGTLLIPRLPFGFTEEMLGIYRVLCVGYAFYATGNCIMLMSLYFADNVGALLSSVVYAVCSVLGTWFTMNGDSRYYGFGFLIAGIIFTATALMRLISYLKKLDYHVISKQPLIQSKKTGPATRLSRKLEERYCEKEKI